MSWKNKTFISLGDSITWQDRRYCSGTQMVSRGYQTIIKEMLGFRDYNNAGVSGRPMANGTINGPGTNTTGQSLDYSPYDLVIIWAGTNDFKLNVPIYKNENLPLNHSFYGAYCELLDYILSNQPKIPILLMTPLHRDNDGYNSWETVNQAGHRLIDYVEIIKTIGIQYNLPVCDLFHESGIEPSNLSLYTWDGLHLNNQGYELVGYVIAHFLKQLNE